MAQKSFPTIGTKDKEQGLRNTPKRNNMAAGRTFTPVAM